MQAFEYKKLPLSKLIDAKRGQSVSVCIPARNEEATIANVVSHIRPLCSAKNPLVDEILVIDDGSDDMTAQVAFQAGARVVKACEPQENAASLAAETSGGQDWDIRKCPHGKGLAMRKGLVEAKGDLVVFFDADVVNFQSDFVAAMVAPLLLDETVQLVKGSYARPTDAHGTGGGRVTELVAKPLLAMLFPHLCHIDQPLAGETAGRRSALEKLELCNGYGVEIAMLIDIAALFGPQSIAQANLEFRIHRNRPLQELGEQAMSVAHAILRRCGTELDDEIVFRRPGLDPVAIDCTSQDPLATTTSP